MNFEKLKIILNEFPEIKKIELDKKTFDLLFEDQGGQFTLNISSFWHGDTEVTKSE